MRLVQLFVAAVLSLAAFPSLAQRAPVPIVNHENLAVARTPGAQPSAEAVKSAIIAAGAAGARQWSVAEVSPGRLLATYKVRTHTVVTEIRYTATNFSVVYSDSTNMKYAPAPGGAGVIHPFYNQWVDEFVLSIRNQLART